MTAARDHRRRANKYDDWPRTDTNTTILPRDGGGYAEVWRGGKCLLRGELRLMQQAYPSAHVRQPTLLLDLDLRIDNWLAVHQA